MKQHNNDNRSENLQAFNMTSCTNIISSSCPIEIFFCDTSNRTIKGIVDASNSLLHRIFVYETWLLFLLVCRITRKWVCKGSKFDKRSLFLTGYKIFALSMKALPFTLVTSCLWTHTDGQGVHTFFPLMSSRESQGLKEEERKRKECCSFFASPHFIARRLNATFSSFLLLPLTLLFLSLVCEETRGGGKGKK